jgi:hypothetical protein
LQPKAPNTSNNNVSYLINKNFAEKKVWLSWPLLECGENAKCLIDRNQRKRKWG